MERARVVANPTAIFYVSNLFPIGRVRIGRVKNRHVVLLDVVHHGEVFAIRRKSSFVADTLDIIEFDIPRIRVRTDFRDFKVSGGSLWVMQTSYRLPILPIYDY